MAATDLGSYTLGGINIGLAAGIGLLNPMLLQVDLLLTGQFGLGSLLADIQAQYAAAVSAVLQLSVSLVNPLQALQQLLMALAQLQAALSVALTFNLALPQISAQIGVMTALGASLAFKLGGIKALVAAGASVKIPMLRYVGQMVAALSAGPVHLIAFRGNTLAGSGAELAAMFGGGLGPQDPLLPNDLVDGIVIVTKDPVVFQALAVILRTS